MKKLFFSFALVALMMTGCYKDDIKDLKSKYDSMQTILAALQKQLSVTSVTPTSDGGYKITFSDGTTADIKQGKDGTNGTNGTNAPAITDIVYKDGNVEFKFSNGQTITMPMTSNFGFTVAGDKVQYFQYSESREFAITQNGVQNISISKPDGWKASISGNKLTVIAPAEANTFAERSGTLYIVAIGNQATAIASLEVQARDYNYVIDFEAPSVLPYIATSNSGTGVFDGGYFDEGSGLKMPASVNQAWGSWSGIAISQFNNMDTEGYTNQLSAYYKDASTGFGGYNGSKTFAVHNDNGTISFDNHTTECTFDHFYVTNNTYAALSMKNGDQFAKKFSYEDHDWFKLVIKATDKSGNPTGAAVEFYLADFRTATSPGILTKWTFVDLHPLGNKVHTISFTLESSDVGQWGMNTPAYFCFDNLAFKK